VSIEPSTGAVGTQFAARLLGWFDRHGRRSLPWQQTQDPYRIWLSEIMLQQTQVETVVPYYLRFLARYPDVRALAGAPLDQVLELWSGLGYYARARNLHAAACAVQAEHGGRFPDEMEALAALPGIGRSTAGAILAFAHGQRQPILDGNVRRVLARYFRIEGPAGRADVERLLWALADYLTPAARVADYTQAIMDLGATVCRRSRPACGACPQQAWCAAHRAGLESGYPVPPRRGQRPERQVFWLLARDAHGRVLLERRPPSGIWGGLWTLPECAPAEDPATWLARHHGLAARERGRWPVLTHDFSHFRLLATPVVLSLGATPPRAMEGPDTVWYNPADPPRRGLPAPLARLLQQLQESQ